MVRRLKCEGRIEYNLLTCANARVVGEKGRVGAAAMVRVSLSRVAIRRKIVVCVRRGIMCVDVEVIAGKKGRFNGMVNISMRIRLLGLKVKTNGERNAQHCDPFAPSLMSRPNHSNAIIPNQKKICTLVTKKS